MDVISETIIFYAARLLPDSTVIMFAGFCYDGKSVEGPWQIIVGPIKFEMLQGRMEKNIHRTAKRENEKPWQEDEYVRIKLHPAELAPDYLFSSRHPRL